MSDRTVKVIVDVVSINGKKTSEDVKKDIRGIGEEAQKTSRKRVSDELRAANEVSRIHKETARQAEQQERFLNRTHASLVRERNQQAKRAADDFLNHLKRVKAEEATINARASLSGSVFKGAFGGSLAGNLTSDAISRLTTFAQEGGAAILDYSAKLQQAQIGFVSLTGSATLAQKHLQDLQNFAKTTPFEFPDLVEASRRLQGVGIEAQRVIPILTGLGNAASSKGLSSEEIKGLTVALSQVVAKGKLAAQEVNQFAERGIPLWQDLAKVTGKSTAELIKLAEAGGISSEIVLQTFQELYGEGSRFGDEMKKQSQTFNGALSNIKDAVYQASATAFKPLFEQISTLAAQMANEINSKGNDFEAVGEVIAKYIGLGLGKATQGLGSWVGNQIGKELAGVFGQSEGSLSKFFGEMERGFDEGFWKPILGDDWFQREWGNKISTPIKQTSNDLNKTGDAVKGVENAVKKVPSIAQMLQAEEAKKQAETLKKVFDDLSLRVQFFGDESEVAAVKQNLLRQGVTNFNTVQAQVVLSLAKTLDGLKANEKAQKEADDKRQKAIDEYTKKVESARDQLIKFRQDADFKIQFAEPTELNRFDRWVSENAESVRGLKSEVDAARRSIISLMKAEEFRQRNQNINNLLESVQNEIDSVLKVEKTFNSTLRDLFKPLGIEKTDYGQAIGFNAQKLADEFETVISKLQDSLALTEKLGQELGLSQQAIDAEVSRKVDESYEKMNAFLSKFRMENGAKIFAEDKNTYESIIYMFNAFGEAWKTEKQEKYQEALAELNEKLLESADKTETLKVKNLLLKDTYKDLTEQQKKNLEAKAAEVDNLAQVKKAQEETQKLYEKTENFFERTFRAATQGGFKSLFKSILGDLRDFLVRAAAQIATSKFFQFLSNGQISGNSGSGGGIFSSLRGLISGGGGAGGNGGGFSLSGLLGGGGFTPTGGFAGGNPVQSILGGGGGILSKIPMLGGLFGGAGAAIGAANGATIAATAGGLSTSATLSGTVGLLGGGTYTAAGASGGGLMSSLGSLFTNPWTAVAAGAAIGGFFLLKHLFGDKSIKRLRQATESLYSIKIDKGTAQGLKEIGEARFGKGAGSKRPLEVIKLEESKDLIRSYAEMTGQSTSRLGASRAELQSEFYSGNRFVSKFGGFRAGGGRVSAGMAYVVGEYRPEVFVPNVSGTIIPSVSQANGANSPQITMMMMQSIGAMIESFQATMSRFQAVSPNAVLMATDSSIIGNKVSQASSNNPDFNYNLQRNQGAGIIW